MPLTEEIWKEQLDLLYTCLTDYRVAMVQAEKHPGEREHHFTIASLTLQKIETLLQSLLKYNPSHVSQEQENAQGQLSFTDWIEGYSMLGADLRTCESYIFFGYTRGNYPNRKDFLRATYTILTKMHLCVLRLIALQGS